MENIRTDLAIEAHEMCSKKKAEETEVRGVLVTEEKRDGVFVTVIDIKNKQGEKELGKPMGKYRSAYGHNIQSIKRIKQKERI